MMFLLTVSHASANSVVINDTLFNISVYQSPIQISNQLISHAPVSQTVPYVPFTDKKTADKDSNLYSLFGMTGIALLVISFGAGSRLFRRK
jgi:hypothetical protein